MKKKLVFKIISLCLGVVLLLSACADKTQQDNSDTNTTILNTTVQPTTETQNTTTPEPTKPIETTKAHVEPETTTEPSTQPSTTTTEKVEPTQAPAEKPVATETKPVFQAKPEQTKQEQPKQEDTSAPTTQAPPKPTTTEETSKKETEVTVQDGIVTEGVLKPTEDTDMTKNPYLVDFMKNNYATDTYDIGGAGVAYSPFGWHGSVGSATIFTAVDSSHGFWYIEVSNFDNDKERPVMLAALKTITADADKVYTKFVEMWDGSTTRQEAIKNFNFGTWVTIGQTTYTFDITNSGQIDLKIKY